MNPKFREAVDSLHPTFERLIAAAPHVKDGKLPKQGVYLFIENGKAMYAGRSNTIPRRLRQHTSPGSQTNQAALATLIARKELGLPVDYRKGARERLLANHEFMTAFRRAKTRVSAMEFRAVEETDQTRQALLEIYCAITLDTPFNDFGTH
ncbi:GIY-YIG nuclease family protein [Bradyrhizobium sp. BEA-2-5]|uniref:GIY-YIG nuclease family protein n=1 Tax=Bradyrhizobium sp. BEA-2-5 TaxID=3080015 RepID=UPI00293E1B00|nr:GIY-YIG nuclease family protein [Bradyrhizobium sp. BEA-2-5]WOH82144.1 GIY-YIG nuclease family protein [Bradyrhizobium sp. BEA-2-5]